MDGARGGMLINWVKKTSLNLLIGLSLLATGSLSAVCIETVLIGQTWKTCRTGPLCSALVRSNWNSRLQCLHGDTINNGASHLVETFFALRIAELDHSTSAVCGWHWFPAAMSRLEPQNIAPHFKQLSLSLSFLSLTPLHVRVRKPMPGLPNVPWAYL